MNRYGRFGNTQSLRPCVECSGISMDVAQSGGKSVGSVRNGRLDKPGSIIQSNEREP